MSVFQTWCRSTHRSLVDAGVRLRLGQAREILSAGLGHRSYASFRSSDLEQLDEAACAVFIVGEMCRRASQLNLRLPEELCYEIIDGLRPNRNDDGRRVVRLEDFRYVVGQVFADTPHPLRNDIAGKLRGTLGDAQAFEEVPSAPLEQAKSQWRWHASGLMNVLSSKDNNFDDYAVSIDAEIAFPKLGRNLLAAGTILKLEQNGEPRVYEPEPEPDFAYLSDSDL